HDAANAAVRDADIGAAAKQRHRDPRVARDFERASNVVGAMREDEPVGGPAELERRERRERRVTRDPIVAERTFQPDGEVVAHLTQPGGFAPRTPCTPPRGDPNPAPGSWLACFARSHCRLSARGLRPADPLHAPPRGPRPRSVVVARLLRSLA